MSHLHSNRSRGLFWGVVIIIIGFLLLFDQQGWLDIDDLWPLAIIALGAWMIIRARTRPEQQSWSKYSNMGDRTFITDSENVFHSNTFGDVKVTINSKDFKNGEIRTTFGDVKVDLTSLEIKAGEPTLKLGNNFGDVKISVPKKVPFSIYGANTAGDMKVFEDQRSGWRQTISYQSEGYETTDKKLKIIVSQMFGDLKVW